METNLRIFLGYPWHVFTELSFSCSSQILYNTIQEKMQENVNTYREMLKKSPKYGEFFQPILSL